MYFKKFPKIYYTLREKNVDVFKIVTDITANVRIRKAALSNITIWESYDIREGETPEIIAEKFYKDATLHWVIMLVNNRYNMYNDFPLSYNELMSYVNKKYPNTQNSIKEYRKDGYVVDSNVVGAVGITNKEYEIEKNETKRRIKIIAPALINTVVQELNDLMSDANSGQTLV
jgi:hypothetical protein